MSVLNTADVGRAERAVNDKTHSNGKAPQPRRLNINLPARTYAELEKLAEESGRTMTELVRVAIGLIQVAIKEEGHEHKLAVIDRDGKLVKELILLR